MRKATKRDAEANQLIQSLVDAGKKKGEIVEILAAKGFKGVAPSRIHYYLYSRKAPKQAAQQTPAPTFTTSGGLNLKRIRDIVNAKFLTDADRALLIKNEVLANG